MRTAGFVVGAVGVASIIAAAITGGLYLGEKGTVDDLCEETNGGRSCTSQEGVDAASRGNTLALINTITLPVGAAAVGAGLVLILLAPDASESSVGVYPTFGPTHAGVHVGGQF